MPEKKRIFSRRDFIKRAGAAGIGSALIPFSALSSIHGSPTTEASEQMTVPTRPFGKTGANVSILSLGGVLKVSDQLIFRQAFKMGVTYWDTADCYQRGSERGIGKFLSRQPDAREKLFIVSKSDARDPDGMTRLLDRSLDRMKTDYVDLYFVHGIYRIDELDDRTKAWAEKAKAAGKIRFFGFSTHSNMEECLRQASRLGWIDCIMMTYNYRLMHEPRMRDAVEACYRAGIGLTAMKTQGGGPVKSDSESEIKMAGRFIQKGFSDYQAKLMAVWQDERIASICSQMPNLTIMATNAAAAVEQNRLSKSDHNLLAQYARETSGDYCAGCERLCSEVLPERVPIGDVMRCLMYFHSYQDYGLARSTFEELPTRTRELLTQLDFTEAEKSCPRKLPIGQLMRETKMLFV